MPDIYDINPLENFMGLFTGPNGSGKSIAIASWMKKGSIYFFDYDGRMASVANWYKERGLERGRLFYDTYGPRNVYDAYTKLQQFAESCPHAAIVIDSFTAVTVSAVTFSLHRRSTKGGKNLPTTSRGDMILPDWDEWNGEATYVTMLLDVCKQIAANGTAVFWTAHPVQRLKIEQSGGRQSISYQQKYAAFGHKSDSLIPIYFNEIYSFRIEQDLQKPQDQQIRRICYTQPYGDVIAKTALSIPVYFDWTDQNFYDVFSSLVKKEGVDGSEVKEEKKSIVDNMFKI